MSEDLAKLAYDLIMPDRLRLWQVRDDEGSLDARTDVAFGTGVSAPAPGVGSVDVSELFQDVPARAQCFRQQRTISLKAKTGRNVYSYFFPVYSGSRVTGVLELERGDAISPYQERIVEGLLQIYRNHIALLDEAEFDPLTGLLNRRCFATTANGPLPPQAPARVGSIEARDWPSATNRGWLAVFDLDHFKRVNDTYGHFIGDEVLVLFAQLIQKGFRDADRAYRFGGEEFVVTISAATDSDIAGIFERFRRSVEEYRFPQAGRITVSIGYTTLKSKEDAAYAFERADKALYFAKSHGRNQVQCYEDLLARGLLEEKVEDRGELVLF